MKIKEKKITKLVQQHVEGYTQSDYRETVEMKLVFLLLHALTQGKRTSTRVYVAEIST